MISRQQVVSSVMKAETKGYRPVVVTTAKDVTEIGTVSPLGDTLNALVGQPYGVILFRAETGEIYEDSLSC